VVSGQMFTITYQGGTGGNDVLLTVPEPTGVCMALVGCALSAGLSRFRRRS